MPVTWTTTSLAAGGVAEVARVCCLARFRPFGFRIHVRPGRPPRLASRGLRSGRAATWLDAITHN